MSLQEFKCPHCGGPVGFDPGAQELVCPFCESVINVEAFKNVDDAQAPAQNDIEWGYSGEEWREGEQDGLLVYSCRSCGGEIVGDETLGASTCPFCGNPVVMTAQFSGTLRPDLVIPFKLNKDAALEALKKHYLGKKLLPRVFKDANHLDEVKGVYVPFWLFDARAAAHIEYNATRLRTWSDSRYDYSETSVYRVTRGGGLGFNAVPVDGSKAIDDALMESIEPFNLSEGVDFQSAYLAGYFANKYDVDADASMAHAADRIRSSTESAFADTVTGYTTVNTGRSMITLNDSRVRYALLPVWLLSTSWNGQSFLFAMNGQTGKFTGDLPVDKQAARKWFWGIFGAVAASLTAISMIVLSFM